MLGAKYTSPHSLVSLGLYINERWNFGTVLSYSGGPKEVNDYLTQTTLACHMNIARGSREPETQCSVSCEFENMLDLQSKGPSTLSLLINQAGKLQAALSGYLADNMKVGVSS